MATVNVRFKDTSTEVYHRVRLVSVYPHKIDETVEPILIIYPMDPDQRSIYIELSIVDTFMVVA